jgi:hypothetical protein
MVGLSEVVAHAARACRAVTRGHRWHSSRCRRLQLSEVDSPRTATVLSATPAIAVLATLPDLTRLGPLLFAIVMTRLRAAVN